jgi:hypothetical protein
MRAPRKLREEFQQEMKQLRETCPHSELTEWMDELYGPAHSTGDKVRLCANCEKVMDRRKAVIGHSNFVF